MKVVHALGKKEVSKDSEENIGFLLANKNNGYCFLSNHFSSRYEGIFFNENGIMFKVIEDVILKGQIRKVVNHGSYVEREKDTNTEKFFMFDKLNTFVYELKNKDWIEVLLDIRGSYDMRNFGRFYNIFEENGKIIVEYVKKTNPSEDSEPDKVEFTNYLVIGSKDYEMAKIENWVPRFYEFDKTRDSGHWERFVFHAFNLEGKEFVFSFSIDKSKAIKENNYVLKNMKKLKALQERNVKKLLTKKLKDEKINTAYKNAIISLNEMATDKGLIGGYPWFFQYWTRDELISLKALMMINDYKLTKYIILRDVNSLLPNGRLPNRFPDTDLQNADSIGWLYFRVNEYMQKKRDLNKNIIKRLEENAHVLIKKFTKDGFAFNNALETWMDTQEISDGRDGVRLEMQALRLSMFRFLSKYDKIYGESERILREKVRLVFWDGNILNDGLNDRTLRPNAFIVYYLYPELLNKKEWEICFENLLRNLWLDWGGLSSIDKKSPLFHERHTGANYKSYHRGDSWYFLNNLAALVMNRLNKRKFSNYIKKIVEASTDEILWHGIIGKHAEISSAIEQGSLGCKDQLWSNAMYIEMIKEVYK